MHRGYTTPLVIAIMAFAIVAFLFLIDTAIMPANSNQTTNRNANKNADDVACTTEAKLCPDGSAVGRSGPKCEFAECPDTTSNSNVNTNDTTNTSEILPTNVARFTSNKLGITFTYLTTAKDYKATVQEIGDKVYVNTDVSVANPITNGQWVQVFSKDSADSITQAITKRFLSGISTQDCFVTIQSRENISSTQSAAIIDWPATLIDENNPFGDNSKCPKEYQKTNGERFFLVDSQDATKLLFFSIGQYAIMGLNDNSTTWQQTLRVIENDPTAGWKTYTNKEHNFSFKYPPTWSATTSSYDPQVAVVTPADAASKTSIELAPTLTVSPVLKIDSSDCVHTEVSSAVSQVTVGTKSVTRTMSGCLASYINTYIPQATPLTGYYVFSWPEVFQDNYPEYETILSTFTYPD